MISEGELGKGSILEEKITIKGHKWHFYTKFIPVVFEEGERGVSVILRDVTVSKVSS